MPLTSSIEKPSSSKAVKFSTVGVLQIVTGVILSALFGIAALVNKVWSVFAQSSGVLALVLFLIGTACGVFFLWKGIRNLKVNGRFRKISGLMGSNTNIKLSYLQQKLGWEPKELVKTLRWQIKNDFWTDAYLDTDNDVFMLGYTPSFIAANSGNSVVDEILAGANGFIHEMTTINLNISDPGLKAAVEKLVDIARQIYTFVKKSPEKARQIRQFSNYYLPLTVNLLKNYLELQSEAIKSESIQESIQKIADSMATIETVFKKQLDDLYKDKAMDITVEIEVLQNMTKEHDSQL